MFRLDWFTFLGRMVSYTCRVCGSSFRSRSPQPPHGSTCPSCHLKLDPLHYARHDPTTGKWHTFGTLATDCPDCKLLPEQTWRGYRDKLKPVVDSGVFFAQLRTGLAAWGSQQSQQEAASVAEDGAGPSGPQNQVPAGTGSHHSGSQNQSPARDGSHHSGSLNQSPAGDGSHRSGSPGSGNGGSTPGSSPGGSSSHRRNRSANGSPPAKEDRSHKGSPSSQTSRSPNGSPSQKDRSRPGTPSSHGGNSSHRGTPLSQRTRSNKGTPCSQVSRIPGSGTSQGGRGSQGSPLAREEGSHPATPLSGRHSQGRDSPASHISVDSQAVDTSMVSIKVEASEYASQPNSPSAVVDGISYKDAVDNKRDVNLAARIFAAMEGCEKIVSPRVAAASVPIVPPTPVANQPPGAQGTSTPKVVDKQSTPKSSGKKRRATAGQLMLSNSSRGSSCAGTKDHQRSGVSDSTQGTTSAPSGVQKEQGSSTPSGGLKPPPGIPKRPQATVTFLSSIQEETGFSLAQLLALAGMGYGGSGTPSGGHTTGGSGTPSGGHTTVPSGHGATTLSTLPTRTEPTPPPGKPAVLSPSLGLGTGGKPPSAPRDKKEQPKGTSSVLSPSLGLGTGDKPPSAPRGTKDPSKGSKSRSTSGTTPPPPSQLPAATAPKGTGKEKRRSKDSKSKDKVERSSDLPPRDAASTHRLASGPLGIPLKVKQEPAPTDPRQSTSKARSQSSHSSRKGARGRVAPSKGSSIATNVLAMWTRRSLGSRPNRLARLYLPPRLSLPLRLRLGPPPSTG